jgi:sugar phosphate permease
MLSTVFAQAQMPRILDRFGYRLVLAVGLLFLGLPAFFYTAAQTLVTILAVTLLRGVGFGVATVVFAALMVELAPPGRRGEALGLLGIAIALPAYLLYRAGALARGAVRLRNRFPARGHCPPLGDRGDLRSP